MIEELVLYDQMRIAISECHKIDELSGIRDQGARLAAAARIRDDKESERKFAQIKLRACQRIGEISRDLEKAEKIGGPGKFKVPTDGKLKSEVLAEAGISTSTAQRYEELAGPKLEQAARVVDKATEAYFAQQAENDKPLSFKGLNAAVDKALEPVLGKKTRKANLRRTVDYRFIDFTGPLLRIAERDDWDFVLMGQAEDAKSWPGRRTKLIRVVELINSYITTVEINL